MSWPQYVHPALRIDIQIKANQTVEIVDPYRCLVWWIG